MKLLTEVLKPHHRRETFSCGNTGLDNYLHKQARQDMKKKVSVCFVHGTANHSVIGYYTLSNGSIPRIELPPTGQHKLPRYEHLPVTILGRLAIDQSHHGKNLGTLLLMDALKRSYFAATQIGSYSVFVDPIDEAASRFYERFGFILLPDSGKLFLPMQMIEWVLSDKG
jgi:GNAT superfamily N-acetyltransferase